MKPHRIAPGPAQESVWDYPRPPGIEPEAERIRVVVAGRVVADSTRALRVLETSHPPNYYVPPSDVDWTLLKAICGTSYCEWKGAARYFDLVVPTPDGVDRRAGAAWAYPEPQPAFAALRHHVAFYAGRVDEAWVGEARATPQPGGFYGGWVTPAVVGPFKGVPGSMGW